GEGSFECVRDVIGKPVDVLRRLPRDPGQRLPFLLRFDDPDRRTVDEEEVVGAAVRYLEDELANRHAPRGTQVHDSGTLDRPPGGGEHPLYPAACPPLRGELRDAHVRIAPRGAFPPAAS